MEVERKAVGRHDVDRAREHNEKLSFRVKAFMIYTHLVALVALLFWKPSLKLIALTIIMWQGSGIGITMGYHRLWSHRAFNACFPLRVVLAVFGAVAFQGSIRWWGIRHRLHHRYTDTNHDPYNANRGFYYTHLGWIFEISHYTRLKMIDTTDFDNDPVVRWQHRYYAALAIGGGIVFPTLLGWLMGDIIGGFLWGGYVARVITWHATFCINSFAHWLGDQDYSLDTSAKGNFLLAVITLGEGYHNFHHEFPSDYRNGIRWYQYDPTKWLILLTNYLGLTWDLHRTSWSEVGRAYVHTQSIKIEQEKQKYNWGPAELPTYTQADVSQKIAEGRMLIVLNGKVYDVTDYASNHPGGSKILKAYNGKDATLEFTDLLNKHTQAAKDIAKTYCVAYFGEKPNHHFE